VKIRWQYCLDNLNKCQLSSVETRILRSKSLLVDNGHVTTPTDRLLVGNDVIDTYRYVHCDVTTCPEAITCRDSAAHN